MELRHLRYFLAVAEELHFTRAAARLHIAQQPLSRHIKELESEIGGTLFRRSTRRVELTDAGRLLLDQVRAGLAHLGRGVDAARRAEQGVLGELVLGFNVSSMFNIFPETIRNLARVPRGKFRDAGGAGGRRRARRLLLPQIARARAPPRH
jgi:DNA-binding transcriptional LysR family regulator